MASGKNATNLLVSLTVVEKRGHETQALSRARSGALRAPQSVGRIRPRARFSARLMGKDMRKHPNLRGLTKSTRSASYARVDLADFLIFSGLGGGRSTI